ncbi:MAG: hypothetical protein AAGD11_09595 [Planctomycetota bacterium]
MLRPLRDKTHRAEFSRINSNSRPLRMEALESKNLLAGDVIAALIGGDLYITGDSADNSVQIVRDVSQTSPGVGDVVVQGFFSNPTTVNGMASQSFTVMGEVFVDFSAGGNNAAIFGDNPSFQPDPVQLPGGVSIVGGVGDEDHSFSNAEVGGDITLDDTAGGAVAFIGIDDGTVVGGDFSSTSLAVSSELDVTDASVGGNVVLATESSTVDESFLGLRDSSVGNDVRHFTDAATSTTLMTGNTVGDDVLVVGGDGDDVVNLVQTTFTNVGNTIGDDLRILTGGGADEVMLADIQVGDDLQFRGGDGDDIFFFEPVGVTNVIGDDVYLTGGQGADEIGVEDADIGDKLRVGTGAGDDVVAIAASTVGRSALVSLGGGLNEASIEETAAGRALTVLGGGTNDILIDAVTTSHFITVVTSSGDDLVTLQDVSTHSALISTHGGMDEVAISESEFDYLFVLLGSGDDSLTLDNVTVDRFAFLHGGSGTDTLVDVDDASDINFELDFAFENYSV